jgi:hypothetical protein
MLARSVAKNPPHPVHDPGDCPGRFVTTSEPFFFISRATFDLLEPYPWTLLFIGSAPLYDVSITQIHGHHANRTLESALHALVTVPEGDSNGVSAY